MPPRSPRASDAVNSHRCDLLIPANVDEHYLCTPTKGASVFRNADLDFAGISKLAAPYHARRWNCWHHILLFTIAGEGVLSCNGRKHVLATGTLCILPAGLSHSFEPRGTWRVVWFHPKPTSYWDQQIGRCVEVRPFLFGQKIDMLAEALWGELGSTDPDSRDATIILSQGLLHYVRRELKQNESALLRRWRLRLETLWEQVIAAPAEWNVAALAGKLACSRTQLHSLCVRLYGRSARDRLTEIRLQRASEYLLYTDWTLDEVAARVGFADAFSFSKAFTRVMKVTPTGYKRSKLSARAFPG